MTVDRWPGWTGTTALLRQDVRRDRVLAPVWLLAMAALALVSAAATGSLLGSPAQQARLATELDRQPALRALYGPILDPHATGELAMNKMTVLYALIASILLVVTVRRHTRVEEESGRAELVGATVVGRAAPLAAAVLEGAALSTLLGLLVAVADIAGGLPVGGSCWFGASWAATGLVATGTTALASQLSASARTCGGIAAALLGGAYLVRALGDGLQVTWLSWLSPLGWNTQLRAWSQPRGWVLLLHLALGAVLVTAAAALRAHRDLGAGLVAARPGRSTGARWLAGPLGLSLRLHRTLLVLWTIAVGGLGVAFGAMAPGLDDLLRSVGAGQELLDRLGGAMIAAILSVMAMVVTTGGLAILGHAAVDETSGRAELVLATGVSRSRWWAAVLITAVASCAWLLLVTGAGLAIGYAAAGGHRPGTAVPAALGWTPAVLDVVVVAALAWAVGPRWAVAGWGVLGVCVLLTLVGDLARLPRWVVDLSPYATVPRYPLDAWSWTAPLVTSAVAIGVTLAAWLRMQRRDIG